MISLGSITNNRKTEKRTLVNVLGAPSIIGAIYLGNWFFFLFIWLICILGSIEYKKISDIQKTSISRNVLFTAITFILLGYKFALDISIILLLIITVMVIELFRFKDKPLFNISSTLFGCLWIGMLLGSLILLRDLDKIGFEIVFMLFISVWSCDSMAFVFGKYLGNKKILPSISPKKTWVGTIAGMVSSIFSVYIFYIYGQYFGFNFIEFRSMFGISDIIYLGIIFGGIGQLGDFFESLLKREAGIKDSSKILRGHGGILDRFDSIIFVAPSTYVYLQLILLGR